MFSSVSYFCVLNLLILKSLSAINTCLKHVIVKTLYISVVIMWFASRKEFAFTNMRYIHLFKDQRYFFSENLSWKDIKNCSEYFSLNYYDYPGRRCYKVEKQCLAPLDEKRNHYSHSCEPENILNNKRNPISLNFAIRSQKPQSFQNVTFRNTLYGTKKLWGLLKGALQLFVNYSERLFNII